jgi:predicted alpha/beta hydrolase family esterase
VLVAHSAGVLVTAHWAAWCSGPVVGALLATPPALAEELPAEYPSIRTLRAHGWLPVPRSPLPFPSIVATSTDDPLGNPVRVRALARAWGSRLRSLGPVGHLNPASGFGEWPDAEGLIAELADSSLLRSA